jgi:hypothetical protein
MEPLFCDAQCKSLLLPAMLLLEHHGSCTGRYPHELMVFLLVLGTVI